MKVVMSSDRPEIVIPKVRSVNKNVYLTIAIVVLMLGVVFGCYLANKIGNTTVKDLRTYLNGFEVKENIGDILTIKNLTNNILENLKFIIVIWLLGFSRYLIFGTMIFNFYKGFIDSFTAWFLISKFGMEGAKLAFLPLIAYKLFYIYLIIFISSSSLGFALNKEKKISLQDKKFRKYILQILIATAITCVVGAIETASAPYILKAMMR